MNDDAKDQAARYTRAAKSVAAQYKQNARKKAELEAQRYTQESERLAQDPELQQEWILQDNLMYGGLVGIGVVMVQPFLTATSMDVSAIISVVAWSIAIPFLAALLLVNRHETFRRRRAQSRLLSMGRGLAMLAALVGLVAGFWHIHWAAGVGVTTAGLVALGVQSAGITHLEFGNKLPWKAKDDAGKGAAGLGPLE